MVSAGAALGRRVSASSTAAAAAAAAAATPRPQRHQQTRRCHSSPAPSTSKATVHLSASSTTVSSTTVSEWPSFLKPRLAELRTNIIDQLAGRDRIPAFMRMRQAAIDAGDGAAAAAPTMEQMARLYFERGGKLFRPRIAMLMASACNQEVLARGSRLSASSSAPHADAAFDAYEDISGRQAAIALIAEMIHVASLVHDDVIDEAATRRGAPSVNGYWGNKMAVLAGDFILARATQALCQIGDPRVISTMAKIIEDLVVGEFLQMSPELSPAGGEDQRTAGDQRSTSSSSLDDRLSLYLQKSERKTASLFENACRSVAMLANASDGGLHGTAAAYGRHVGLAFQLIDDAIDYEAEEEEDSAAAGKPIAVDLEQGLITGPLLLAVSSETELARLLRASPAQIRETVRRSGACERTRELATTHARRAAEIATSLRCRNGASEALAGLALKQLERRV